ncbi:MULTISPECIES: outer membrane beta-barrel protein [unclassified Nitratiruptor]|uniref:outer membrane beta-barrel protein n=1 Tax=unclassified Nitratiruptor TaxID=2624044 RepID=UPI0019163711|nr:MULTISPECIES: outer membrane beta-barrel protein [unclassified Nitratiruptor]BCD59802.1 hypothetical protein NitYY0810_C0559 [Nitratiruptor sp. YY08-10]BCD63726.1 hypothetical protein NitYY0814_C0559 [Nitratiruptor sp. YY08-14]
MSYLQKIVPLSLVAAMSLPAFSSELEELKAQMKKMQERILELEMKQQKQEERSQTMLEELGTIQSEGWFQTVDISKSHSGLGSAASKVYYTQNPLSIGGYGELYWADSSGKKAITDVYRFVPYIGYKFNDWIVLNSELEFEHGGEEVAIEFLYLDFLLSENLNVRVGNQLVPVGLVNQKHEPTLFPTVLRPETETYIIPSTWSETGVIAYGKIGKSDFDYHIGIINALNANNADAAASGKKWIRNGRWGSANKATMQKLALTGRLDYSGVEGLTVGGSFYYGSGSNAKTNVPDTSLFIYDLHAMYQKDAFMFRGLFTQAFLDNAKNIAPSAPKKAQGYYLNAEYDVLSLVGSSFRLPVFIQYENYNPVKETANGQNEMNDIENWTFGFNFYPHEQVVLKADYQIKDNNDGSDKVDTVSLGLGFIF